MNIPRKFCIGGGRVVNVKVLDDLDGKYGDFNDAKSEIRIARTINIDNEDIVISEEDRERTFWHEFVHAMNWYYNCENDESLAQTFSNFLYEFMHTKE